MYVVIPHFQHVIVKKNCSVLQVGTAANVNSASSEDSKLDDHSPAAQPIQSVWELLSAALRQNCNSREQHAEFSDHRAADADSQEAQSPPPLGSFLAAAATFPSPKLPGGCAVITRNLWNTLGRPEEGSTLLVYHWLDVDTMDRAPGAPQMAGSANHKRSSKAAEGEDTASEDLDMSRLSLSDASSQPAMTTALCSDANLKQAAGQAAHSNAEPQLWLRLCSDRRTGSPACLPSREDSAPPQLSVSVLGGSTHSMATHQKLIEEAAKRHLSGR
jgi:hypothetical protein